MIHSFKYVSEHLGEVGKVVGVAKGLVWSTDLSGATIGEAVTFETGQHGMVMMLLEDRVMIAVLSRENIRVGTKVGRTGEKMKVTVGEGMLGRTVTSLGYSTYEDKVASVISESHIIDVPAVELVKRRSIKQNLTTGVMTVDLLMPLGKGQRELVIGDRKTGKSFFVKQTILTQAKAGNICVIAVIGKPKSEVWAYENFLRENGIDEQCVMVAEDAQASSGEVFLAPFTAMAIAEYFRDQGKDVVVILDDLSRHAQYYREMALLSGSFPGREAYPGDIFFVHAHLLERAGCFDVNGKVVTISCFPIVETVEGDLTGYLQTNLMSMTDGHLFFDINLYQNGLRPAINTRLSVTRVGRQTQGQLLRQVERKILDVLYKANELSRFARFGAELSADATTILDLAKRLQAVMQQDQLRTMSTSEQLYRLGRIWLTTQLDSDIKLSKEVESLSLASNWAELMDKIKRLEGLS
jgi:F-type H+-transporting ATPase subunit alpha